MPNIFKQPGTLNNSGKLTFRTLDTVFPITITFSSTDITINSLAGVANNVSIPNKYIVIGTGTASPGITYSTFRISDTTNRFGIYGVQQIAPLGSIIGSYISSNLKYSFILGRISSNLNSVTLTKDGSMVINSSITGDKSRTNTFINSNASTTFYRNYLSSLISSTSNFIRDSLSPVLISSTNINIDNSINSTVVSSYGSNINTGFDAGTAKMGKSNTIVTSINSCIASYCVENNAILSSKLSNISGSPNQLGVLKNNAILSSTNAQIFANYMTSRGNSILSSVSSQIYCSNKSSILSSRNISIHSSGSVILSSCSVSSLNSSNNNVVMSSYYITSDSGVYSSSFNSILSSNRIFNYSAGSYNTIISSKCISIQGSYNTVIGSRCCLKGGYNYNLPIYCNSMIVSSNASIGKNQYNAFIFPIENNSLKTSISGYSNDSSFLTISGKCNIAKSLSTIIGGYRNFSGRTSDSNYTTTNSGGVKSESRYSIHNTFTIGGKNNISSANYGGIIIGGDNNRLFNTIESMIVSSCESFICAHGFYAVNGYQNENSVSTSMIIASKSARFRNSSISGYSNFAVLAKNSGIIGGSYNNLYTCGQWSGGSLPVGTETKSQIILGGSSLCTGVFPSVGSLYNYSITVQNLLVTSAIIGVTGSTCCVGVTGTWTNPNFICIVDGIVTAVG